MPAQKYADLEKLYNTAAQENAQWAQRYQQVGTGACLGHAATDAL